VINIQKINENSIEFSLSTQTWSRFKLSQLEPYTTLAYAYQQPISNTSHNGHNYFDSDNTLSMSAEYDFMNRGILPLISNLSLNKPQSLYTEILITFIIMSNTIPKECTAHFTEYVVPFLTCI